MCWVEEARLKHVVQESQLKHVVQHSCAGPHADIERVQNCFSARGTGCLERSSCTRQVAFFAIDHNIQHVAYRDVRMRSFSCAPSSNVVRCRHLSRRRFQTVPGAWLRDRTNDLVTLVEGIAALVVRCFAWSIEGERMLVLSWPLQLSHGPEWQRLSVGPPSCWTPVGCSSDVHCRSFD